MRKIAIYPGRFQPPHKGHKYTYDKLCKKFGKENVYVCTSDNISLPKNILSFETKKILLEKIGMKNIIKSINPYRLEYFFTETKINPANVICFVALGNKDKNRLKLNEGYYLSYSKYKKDEIYTGDKHAYVLFIKSKMSAKDIRESILKTENRIELEKIWNSKTGMTNNELEIFENEIRKKI